jgi:hypothetical protein
MKKASPRAKSETPPQQAECGPDRSYPLLPIKAAIQSCEEYQFAKSARANPNGEYAVVDAPKEGDHTGN